MTLPASWGRGWRARLRTAACQRRATRNSRQRGQTAAAGLPSASKCGARREAFRAGIESRKADFEVLRPGRNEAPAHQGENAAAGGGNDDREFRSRRCIPARPVVADLVEIDFQVEFDLGNVVRKFGAAAHGCAPEDSMKIAAVQR